MDLANNHDGSLSHGKRIIDHIYDVSKNFNFPVAVKFQYRNLPDFIQRSFQDRFDLKYVDRFLSTKMDWRDYLELRNYIKEKGLLAACTPFDEFSVDKIVEHEFDILKIASNFKEKHLSDDSVGDDRIFSNINEINSKVELSF